MFRSSREDGNSRHYDPALYRPCDRVNPKTSVFRVSNVSPTLRYCARKFPARLGPETFETRNTVKPSAAKTRDAQPRNSMHHDLDLATTPIAKRRCFVFQLFH
jgi:hypothetical protein